jgi:hypothetical protein
MMKLNDYTKLVIGSHRFPKRCLCITGKPWEPWLGYDTPTANATTHQRTTSAALLLSLKPLPVADGATNTLFRHLRPMPLCKMLHYPASFREIDPYVDPATLWLPKQAACHTKFSRTLLCASNFTIARLHRFPGVSNGTHAGPGVRGRGGRGEGPGPRGRGQMRGGEGLGLRG